MTTLPTYTYLADFVVILDRADHLVIEQLDDRKVSVKGIDFGIGPKANTVVGAWLELDTAARDELAPAINAYLHKLFADWQTKVEQPAETEIERRVRNAIEHADGLEIRPEHNVTRDQLRRYGVTQSLSGFRIGDLSAALTVRETAAERGRLGRPLRKSDLVDLLVRKFLDA